MGAQKTRPPIYFVEVEREIIMPIQFIVFDEEDMKRLVDGELVYQYYDDLPDLVFCTEDSYKKFLKFLKKKEDE